MDVRGVVDEKQTCEHRVRALLAEITLNETCLRGPADAALDEMGVDSIGMIDLVYGLEEHFAITIADEEVLPENFGSIAALTALVTRKCA
jgi:acyl carrier protein